MSKTNLLIGGSGFIGRYLARALTQAGQKVLILAKDRSAEFETVTAELTPASAPDELIATADNVFILLGQKTGPDFDRVREEQILNRLLQPLKNGHQKVFYLSSVQVYGESPQPAIETQTLRPIGDYAQFKQAAEQVLTDSIPADRLVIFRLTNVYGDPANRGFINGLMYRALGTVNEPLILNGYGQLERDYVLVDDVAKAIVTVASNPGASGIINIATGSSHSLENVVKLAQTVTGQNISYQLTDQTQAEPNILLVSNHRLQAEFGYNHFTPLAVGLKITWNRYITKDSHD